MTKYMYKSKTSGVYGQYDKAPTAKEIQSNPSVEPEEMECIRLFTMLNKLTNIR